MIDQKALLLARIAAARAELWRELLAQDEATLSTQPIAGEWTAKDLLAHVAAWDDNHAARIELIPDRLAEIGRRPDRDVLNEQIFAERADWPLSRVVDAAQAARARFLALLATLSWQEICREHESPSGEKISILFLAERRAAHDADHLAELKAWAAEAQPEDVPGPKSVLAAALAAGRDALLAWGRLIPEPEQATRAICGTWTWQDVLGHLADWEQFCVQGLRDMARRQPGGTDFPDDIDAWNLHHTARRAA